MAAQEQKELIFRIEHFGHLIINIYVSKQTQKYIFMRVNYQKNIHSFGFLQDSSDVCRLCTAGFVQVVLVSTSVQSEDQQWIQLIVQTVVQLLAPLFLSATSSICLILLSMISSLLDSLRARSWALSSSTSSKNLCLQGEEEEEEVLLL